MLAEDEAGANRALGEALIRPHEKWWAETTLSNLQLIRLARDARGTPTLWTHNIEDALRESY